MPCRVFVRQWGTRMTVTTVTTHACTVSLLIVRRSGHCIPMLGGVPSRGFLSVLRSGPPEAYVFPRNAAAGSAHADRFLVTADLETAAVSGEMRSTPAVLCPGPREYAAVFEKWFEVIQHRPPFFTGPQGWWLKTWEQQRWFIRQWGVNNAQSDFGI